MKLKTYEHSYKEEDVTPKNRGFWKDFWNGRDTIWVNYWKYIGTKNIVLKHVSAISYTKPEEHRDKSRYYTSVDYRLPKMGCIIVDGIEYIVSVEDAEVIEKKVI